MKRELSVLSLFFALLVSLVAGIETVKVARANPIGNIPVPHIGISYTPHPHNQYENSTVNLKIYVNMFPDSPQLNRISYSLDGEPLVNIENFKVSIITDFGSEKRFSKVKFYEANATLEDLSEGNHTIVAYAGGMSASRAFTVNSHYVVTEINVLSPTNQTCSNSVPLLFTVNGKIEEAHYYLYRGKYDAVFEGSFSGNTTLDLSIGEYEMYLYVTTEHGQSTASTYFSVLPSSTSKSNYLEDSSLLAVSIMAFIVIGVGIGLHVYFRKR